MEDAMNKSVILLSSLLFPTFAVAAPFCAVTGYGTYCGYYDVQTCQHAAGPSGACVANPDQGDSASRRPPVKFLEGGITTDRIRRNREAAAKQRAEEQEAELRQLEIEQRHRDLNRQNNIEAPIPAPVTTPTDPNAPLVLVCNLRDSGRNQVEQVTFTIDLVNQTVNFGPTANSLPARISDNAIEWEFEHKVNKEHVYTKINRLTGSLSGKAGKDDLQGKCAVFSQADRKF